MCTWQGRGCWEGEAGVAKDNSKIEGTEEWTIWVSEDSWSSEGSVAVGYRSGGHGWTGGGKSWLGHGGSGEDERAEIPAVTHNPPYQHLTCTLNCSGTVAVLPLQFVLELHSIYSCTMHVKALTGSKVNHCCYTTSFSICVWNQLYETAIANLAHI